MRPNRRSRKLGSSQGWVCRRSMRTCRGQLLGNIWMTSPQVKWWFLLQLGFQWISLSSFKPLNAVQKQLNWIWIGFLHPYAPCKKNRQPRVWVVEPWKKPWLIFSINEQKFQQDGSQDLREQTAHHTPVHVVTNPATALKGTSNSGQGINRMTSPINDTGWWTKFHRVKDPEYASYN